jgi:hypothetical protein
MHEIISDCLPLLVFSFAIHPEILHHCTTNLEQLPETKHDDRGSPLPERQKKEQ